MIRFFRLGCLPRLTASLTLTFSLLTLNISGQTPPAEMNLVVMEGEGVANQPRQHVAVEPVVKAEDENHRPIAGAAIVFTLPISGTSGEFPNRSKSLTVTTGADGLAAAHGLRTNQTPGRLQIYVTASYRGLRARTLINQTITGPSGPTASGGGSKVWVILAVVGAAAAGGAVVALQSKGNSSNNSTTPPPSGPTPIGITPGTGSIAPPH